MPTPDNLRQPLFFGQHRHNLLANLRGAAVGAKRFHVGDVVNLRFVMILGARFQFE